MTKRLTQLSEYNSNTCLTALWPGLPGWAGTRKVKLIWILQKQETVGGSGTSWAICKSASGRRHHSVAARGWQVDGSARWRRLACGLCLV